MFRIRPLAPAVAGLALLYPVVPAAAEITSIAGFVEAFIQEFAGGQEGNRTRATDSFPTTQSELPLQVIATFGTEVASAPSAAAVAAQFADPRDLDQPNPEEFAINLTLHSLASDVRYDARAVSQETRGVLFSPGEIAGTAEGDELTLTGRLFLDGALAIAARDATRDLTGAGAVVKVTVQQIGDSDPPTTVFSGEVSFTGSTAGQTQVGASGDFPTSALIFTDLSALDDDLDVFRLLVIPGVAIDYTFTAVVGEPLTLRATVEVEAANLEDNVRVAVVLGAPTDTITDVLGVTAGPDAARKFLDALQAERESPTGEPAFPAPGLGVCAPLGFGSLALLAAGCLCTGLHPRRRGACLSDCAGRERPG